MQTLQFTRTLRRIVAELKAQPTVDFLAPFLNVGSTQGIDQPTKDKFSTLIYEAIAGFTSLERDNTARTMAEALGISGIYSPPRIGKLLGAFTSAGNAQNIWGNQSVLSEFITFVDLLRWLMRFSQASTTLLETERLGPDLPTSATVELELVDYDGTGVDGSRLEQFFTTLNKLHEELERALAVRDARLKILYVDSGSNLIIAVQTAKEISEALRLLFKELWAKIKYRRFEDFDRKVESLTQGLTFTQKVNEQVQSGALTHEEGRILKVRVLSEMVTLIGVGANLPATTEAESKEQVKLLTEVRGVKLLGSGSPEPAPGSAQPPPSQGPPVENS